MQIQTGTVTVTNGDTTVVASVDADWTDALVALQTGLPVFFSLLDDGEVPRQVVALTPPSLSLSGFWELTLAAAWNGTTQADVSYLIQKDFTTNLELPICYANDEQVNQFIARMAQILDTAWTSNTANTAPPTDSANMTTYVQAGKTMFVSDDLEIPSGVDLEIVAGGRVEVS